MKRLLVLTVLAFAAWQAWQHYPELGKPRPAHQLVISNGTGHPVERIRMKIGGQSFVKETLARGESASFEFRVSRDTGFHLTWWRQDGNGEHNWQGGLVPRGPMVHRYVFTIARGGGVTYTIQEIPQPPS